MSANPATATPVQPRGAHDSSVDLSSEVTVFVTTVGAPTFAACVEHLQAQDCTFGTEVIEHVAPMSAAFQRMIDRCTTPFYVQVDEDMLLDPHAIRTLHQRITGLPPTTAAYIADLYDVHLERCILGVKIFRHEIVRRYPFSSIAAFESEQVTRLVADGYDTVRTNPGKDRVAGQTLGLHGTRWTPEAIYERYASLQQRHRAYRPLRWFDEYPAEFLRRFLDDPNEENFFAVMGVIAGALAARDGLNGAKDFRTYDSLPGFAPLRQFLAALETSKGGNQRSE